MCGLRGPAPAGISARWAFSSNCRHPNIGERSATSATPPGALFIHNSLCLNHLQPIRPKSAPPKIPFTAEFDYISFVCNIDFGVEPSRVLLLNRDRTGRPPDKPLSTLEDDNCETNPSRPCPNPRPTGLRTRNTTMRNEPTVAEPPSIQIFAATFRCVAPPPTAGLNPWPLDRNWRTNPFSPRLTPYPTTL